jgi:hypothetical protein
LLRVLTSSSRALKLRPSKVPALPLQDLRLPRDPRHLPLLYLRQAKSLTRTILS